jgi:hypothetical protein
MINNNLAIALIFLTLTLFLIANEKLYIKVLKRGVKNVTQL